MKEIVKNIESGAVLIELSKECYEYEAILRTTYKFTDRCYLSIDPISENVTGVFLRPKDEGDVNLEKVARDFCNELIDQQLRIIVERNYGDIRKEIVKKAFSPIN